jgi:hypothetical protein
MGQLSPAEHQYAAAYLEGSRALLLNSVNGLPVEVLQFRPAPSEWSIADCIEHCSTAEDLGWQWLQMALQAPGEPVKAPEWTGKNPASELLGEERIIEQMTDRRHRFKTLPMLEPTGKFLYVEEALQHFTSKRKDFISYALRTKDNLKDHFVTHPVTGRISLYQLLILQSAHLQRHVLQIEAIKAHPDCPNPLKAAKQPCGVQE